MKSLIIGALAGMVSANLEQEFMQYVADWSKSYGTIEEWRFRLARFAETHQAIEEHNQSNIGKFEMGHNKFSDWTDMEITRVKGYKESLRTAEDVIEPSYIQYNGSSSPIDWRTKNAVTPVKDQGQCGSCWAFSTTGAIEGAHAVKTGKLLSFSEQQFVDCSKRNDGCNGGLQDLAMKYAESSFVELESSYKYKGKDGTCKYDKRDATNVEVTNYVSLKAKNPSQMKAALMNQVLSVSVDAVPKQFMNYKKGIYDKVPTIVRLDHAVLVVGWGEENGTPYWIMKNSWNTSWGEKGYMRMEIIDNSVGPAAVQKEPLYCETN